MVIDKKRITNHIEMIREDNGERYFRWYGADMKKYSDFKDNFRWRQRIFKHKITQKLFKCIIKKLAIYLSKHSSYRKSEKEDHPQDYKMEVIYNKDGFKAEVTKYQSVDKCYYELKFGKLSWYAHTEYELYILFINKIIIAPYAFPYCSK